MISVLIIGSGAMANAFAARLFPLKECSIHIYSDWQAGNQAIAQHGISLLQQNQSLQTPPLPASNTLDEIPMVDLMLVLVKSWQTEAMIHAVHDKLKPEGVCITLQNGLGNDRILQNALGSHRVNLGTTTLGATLLGPGRVQIHMQGSILLGEHPGNTWIVPFFEQAGFNLEIVENLQSVVWGKLVINAVINPLSALLQVPNGGLDDDPYSLALADRIIDEVLMLMDQKGIPLPYENAHDKVREIMRQSEHNHSSMLQDWQRNAPTEIESITGAILREAENCQLDLPVNQTIYQLMKTSLLRKQAQNG